MGYNHHTYIIQNPQPKHISFTINIMQYRKSGNFHVKIIRVLNIHIDLFSWVYGTHKNIFTLTYFNMNVYYHRIVDIMHE